MKLKRIAYYIILMMAITGIFLFPYGILNTMVSLKYETDKAGDCISVISGDNLCESISNMKVYFIIAVILMAILIIFKRRILIQKTPSPK
ncbi:hypothetical protein SRABI27_04529 [Pedobacter sp. Bi27]|uniref:hypothetical protein n=1 Tax=unclassified Pedobacter TaxID=2628915 RepID=UPI001E17E32B|nr:MULTISPECIES: hypothetical protein [unclassified Pedobacter]CAH0193011.1 hypothetical protein SRABI36_01799 [Pedobacter sp. Bi36]CAH0248677.1 hypothetical protein SRABI126_02893 [Pedobacter sp. Bi126]CAH0304849.1 hypothetical protein SRABI27_04529 [Pedobacter sp. Bi27]